MYFFYCIYNLVRLRISKKINLKIIFMDEITKYYNE